ncbi:hypothetical protein C0J52_09805 [Blattella germanica]|nr:hypothetical protein C0J52_09805 [Blattella germanica]
MISVFIFIIQMKVVQVNQAGQVIQGANGQQLMVHAVPQGAQTIQVATQGGQALQQIQVVPVSSLQKYLHESRHRHAMNRIRGEGGRFHSGSVKKRNSYRIDVNIFTPVMFYISHNIHNSHNVRSGLNIPVTSTSSQVDTDNIGSALVIESGGTALPDMIADPLSVVASEGQ